MAEVRLTTSNVVPVSYVDNVVLTTAKITPPSMTYVDPVTKVTAQPSAAFISYISGEPVTLEARTNRKVDLVVNLQGRVNRMVEVDTPFHYSLDGATARNITNTVELSSVLQRDIISYNVRLDCYTRRVVTNDITLEGNINRNTQIEVKLSSKLNRSIITDGEIPAEVVHKEYGSFVSKEKLYRVQHDVLDENVSDNPYFNKDIANINNAVLLTKNQTVIKAINEIFVKQRDLFFNNINAVKKFNKTIGDIVVDRNLNREYRKLGASSIIDALVKLSNGIHDVENYIGMNQDDDDLTESLLDYVKRLDQRIQEITIEWEDIKESDIEWIFKASQQIPEMEERVYNLINEMDENFNNFKEQVERKFLEFTHQTTETITENYNGLLEKINMLTARVEELENAKRRISKKLNMLTQQVILAFREYVGMNEADIRAIFGMLENFDDDPGEIADSAYDRLVAYINEQIANIDHSVSGLDNRVTELENKFGTTFTIDDLATEEDIDAMFTDIVSSEGHILHTTDIADMIVPEEDIDNLYTSTVTDGGSDVSVQELLDMIATEEDIQDLFRSESPKSADSMRTLMRNIATASHIANQNTNNENNE